MEIHIEMGLCLYCAFLMRNCHEKVFLIFYFAFIFFLIEIWDELSDRSFTAFQAKFSGTLGLSFLTGLFYHSIYKFFGIME